MILHNLSCGEILYETINVLINEIEKRYFRGFSFKEAYEEEFNDKDLDFINCVAFGKQQR